MRSSKLLKCASSYSIALPLALTLLVFAKESRAQGCVPAKFVPLSLNARGVTVLQGGEFQASVGYRYLYADEGYIGTDKDPEYKETLGNQVTIHSVDLQLTYAITPRYTVAVTLPFVSAKLSDKFEHIFGERHSTHAGGLGDIRLMGNAWLLDPVEYPDGNVSIGVGVKFPSGDSDATDIFQKRSGPEDRAVAVNIQPGDGGWGMPLELLGYQKVYERLYAYLSGFYLINPREKNDTLTTTPIYGEYRKNSVPDQYIGRGGLSYIVWPEQNLSLSFGGRIDGVPPHDAIGGSDGFRVPGYSITVEPGVSWTYDRHTVSLFAPVLVEANRQKSTLDDEFNGHGSAAFADWVIISSYSLRF